MKRRFTLNGVGELVDRDGVVLGRITSITIDIPVSPERVVDDAEKGDGEGAIPGTYREVVFSSSSTAKNEEENQPLTPQNGPNEPSKIEIVWAEYVEVMEPRSRALDPQTRAIIRDALKVASLEECCCAIRACKASRFHMGDNDRGRKYNKLSHILKGKRGIRTTREQIDFFLDLAEKGGLEAGVSSADRAKLERMKKAVLVAAEFPGDEQVVNRGEEASRWLRDHGWEIRTDEAGWPSFVPPAVS